MLHRNHDDVDQRLLRWRIPLGYSVNHWDSSEVPLMLMGSVFDANSFGKWCFDWAVHRSGSGNTLVSQVAGELWLLLVRFAGGRKAVSKGMVDEYDRMLPDEVMMFEEMEERGARLWLRLQGLLDRCGRRMLKVAVSGSSPRLGSAAGVAVGWEFVDSVFGRGRLARSTEDVVESIRLWNGRFEVNCRELLGVLGRRPCRSSDTGR